MSGGGGFYKFRCKYFYTHECPNWVYVNNTPCAQCSAQGRETEPAASQAPNTGYPRENLVPVAEEGVIHYIMQVEHDPNELPGNHLTVGYGTNSQAPAQVPTTTSAIPGTPVTTTSF